MKNCIKCGAQLEDGAMFCIKCGEKVGDPQYEEPVTENEEVEENNEVEEVDELEEEVFQDTESDLNATVSVKSPGYNPAAHQQTAQPVVPPVQQYAEPQQYAQQQQYAQPQQYAQQQQYSQMPQMNYSINVPQLSAKEEKAAAKAAAKANKEAAKAALRADKAAEKAARVMPTSNSVAAIAAFVLAIFAMFNAFNIIAIPVAAVAAFVNIFVSIAGIANTGVGRASGRGLAVTALILSLVTLITIALMVVGLFMAFESVIDSLGDIPELVKDIVSSGVEVLKTFGEGQFTIVTDGTLLQ